jgi:CRISPR-associated protein Cas1
MWFDDNQRLNAAKQLQQKRLLVIKDQWLSKRLQKLGEFKINESRLIQLCDSASKAIAEAFDTNQLLIEEARLSKELYKLASGATRYGEFTRAKRGTGGDPANQFLDHGNYLAYGLGATATWVLGLPHGLSVLHGKTRRGALVFDVADIIKDGIILPQAFLSAQQGHSETEFRHGCIEVLTREEALDCMIETIKSIAVSGKTR